jgi:hypothetical protein
MQWCVSQNSEDGFEGGLNNNMWSYLYSRRGGCPDSCPSTFQQQRQASTHH